MNFMVKNFVFIIALAILLIPFSSSLENSLARFELSYDDGTWDYGWSDFYPSGAAVKFFPFSSWRIKAIRIYSVCILQGPSSAFYVQIWDKNLNVKYSGSFFFDKVFKNSIVDWYTIELPNVIVTGEFYVVIIPMFTLDCSQLWIGIDDDPPISNMSFIFDVNKHKILTSLSVNSKRPGDFMIRVIGEPTPTLPELKLTSIEVGVDETTVVFTYPGESMGLGAKLIKPDSTFSEENVTKVGEDIIVKIKEPGVLNVFVITPNNDIIGNSVKLTGDLRIVYKDLLVNYTILKHNAEDMLEKIDSLIKENDDLKVQLNQSQALIRLQEKRIEEFLSQLNKSQVLTKLQEKKIKEILAIFNESQALITLQKNEIEKLLANMSSLNEELNTIKSEVSILRSSNNLLTIGLILAIIVASSFVFIEMKRRWKRKS